MNIDPNMDPELAEAIRISLEEAKAAENAANNAAASNASESRPNANKDTQPGLSRVAEEDDGMYSDDGDEEAALKEALALSMMPDKKDGAQAEGENKTEAKQEEKAKPEVDIDTDMMKDVIGELGIQLDENALDDIVKEAKNEANKEEKDKDKKDGEDKK